MNSTKAKSLFITATDTNVGKTLLTTLLSRALICAGYNVAVYKPIQTGCQINKNLSSLGSEDLEFVLKHSPKASVKCTYCLALPATPELAAKEENLEINLQKINDDYLELCEKHDFVLLEGAGGLIVPIKDGFTMADLAVSFGCKSILLVPNKLGCINQASLSAHYAKSRGIELKGFIMNNFFASDSSSDKVLEANSSFIKEYARLAFLGDLPQIDFNDDALFLHETKNFLKLNPLDWFK